MNNLTHTQQEAKDAFLNNQQEQLPALYEKAGKNKRKAIIKQIDVFLSTISEDQGIF